MIQRLFGRSSRIGICGDIEHLPLASQSLDLLWSNLAIQWCNDLDLAFGEMHRVLKTDGLVMFSTFGPDTLKELRAAANVDAGHVHVSRFIDMHDIGDALVRAGFSAPVLDVERFVLTYDDVLRQDLRIMDGAAIALARDNRIPIIVFSIKSQGGLASVLLGQGSSTLIEARGA